MTQARDAQAGSEIRDGMKIDWDVPVPMDDGIILRADVFRPVSEGRYPVLLTYGPYAKGLAFQEGYPDAWQTMAQEHPDVPAGSTNLYQNWEVVDPEKWVPHGYACVRVDSRGCGRSPGYVDPFSPRETRDFSACIAWAGEQPWSSGVVPRYFASRRHLLHVLGKLVRHAGQDSAIRAWRARAPQPRYR